MAVILGKTVTNNKDDVAHTVRFASPVAARAVDQIICSHVGVSSISGKPQCLLRNITLSVVLHFEMQLQTFCSASG